jgi:hypothetical protein
MFEFAMSKTKVTIFAVTVILIVVIALVASGSIIIPHDKEPTPTPVGQTPTPILTSTPTPTPAPTLTPTPTPTPTPKMNYSVGISVHPPFSASDAQFVAKSGASWVRIDVSPDFSNAVANAKAQNLKVLGILGSWMFDKSIIFSLDDWQSNVTYYVSQNPNVDAWEIWNEPANPTYPLLNLNIIPPNSQQNMNTIAQFYYNMSKIAYPIIRTYDPSATIVLMGGLNLYSGGALNLWLDEQFASLTSSMNIAQYGDVISVHAYSWLGVQPSTQQVWDSYTQSLTYYRNLFPNLDIWVTETGQQFDQSNQNEEANYLTNAFQVFNGKVTNVFWYSLKDNSWELPQQQFGLVNSDGTTRPAYNEMQKLTGR